MMDTKLENDYPSPMNDESDGENQDTADYPEEAVDTKPPPVGNVADILKRLQSSGALIKKPKEEYRCVTCDEDFRDWDELEQHLIQHVSLPSVVLDKLPSDDEDNINSEDENWSDEDDDSQTKLPQTYKAPQKVDISQIKQTLNKTGITLTKPTMPSSNNADAALNKLSGLGFTIKKNSSPIKQEKPDPPSSNNDLMKKLGQLGGIKLKLKSDGNNTNSFKVVNGLKDFNASDDEGDGSGNDGTNEDDAEVEQGKDEDSDEEQPPSQKNSESDEGDDSPVVKDTTQKANHIMSNIIPKIENQKPVEKVQPKLTNRPAVKQTPKRATNVPFSRPQQDTPPPEIKETSKNSSLVSTPERRESRDSNVSNTSTVVVKQEVDKGDSSLTSSSAMPLFSGQIKSERNSPPIEEISTPIIATVKSEPDVGPIVTQSVLNNFSAPAITTPLLPVTKKEDTGPTIIEINGDSNDEDDDCCVVSSTPAPDIKPVIPKTEVISTTSSYALPSYPTSQSSFSSSNILPSRLSMPSYTEKQHAFNWNAPDSKPPLDMLEKSADDIFESLLSSAKKENHSSLSEASEYISLDTLGPQHSCDVCNTRFTDISLLEDHKRMTGHSHSLVAAPSSSTLVPYSSSNILSSLLPVKQLAEQVGKLVPSGMGNSSAFTHQQNVMINIQAYPGAGMPQSYNAYPQGQNMHQGYQQPQTNMYGQPMSGQQMPGQYPGQGFVGGNQGFGQQYSQPMSKSGYSPSYSTHSPLQGMQQAVYGQSPMNQMGSQGQMNMGGQMGPSGLMNISGQMGPPSSQPNMYNQSSSPSGMKAPNNNPIKIQNIQTFPPGNVAGGQSQSMEMPPPPQPGIPGQHGQNSSPGTIRMAPGAMSRPRNPGPRGPRPTIRPGIQVQGQVRGAKPNMRMPLKRPVGISGGGPIQKRRPDMLLPGKHDNEDCQVMAMQKQRQGMPMIHSVQGAKDKLNLGSQISITKKTVNREANAMADVLASRGISVKQKQRSRSPTPERPIPHIPNLPAGMSIKHTSKSSNFSIPESKVGSGNMLSCRVCKKMFSNSPSLQVHMSNAHPQSKIPMFKCDECPASYPKSLQLQHHKRTFHNLTGPNRELGIPIVDMSDEDNLKKLCNVGIYSYIPLAQGNGCFGLPIISVHSMQNGNTKALLGLGADGLLSLGPLKPLPNT